MQLRIALLLLLPLLYASDVAAPPATEASFVGDWEGTWGVSTRIFRSLLAYSLGPSGPVYVYEQTSRRVEKGRVQLRFKQLDSEEVIEITGDAISSAPGEKEGGVFDAKVVIAPDEKPTDPWSVEFVRLRNQHSYAQDLCGSSQQAQKAIEQTEKNRPKPSNGP